jgi:hypothetical protein
MIEPINPNDVIKAKFKQIPDEVIESFNEMIAKTYFNGRASFKQDDVLKLVVDKMEATKNKDSSSDDNWIKQSHSEIFDNHWLDVEDIYRRVGWDVKYDKPGYNETYSATFTFKKKAT